MIIVIDAGGVHRSTTADPAAVADPLPDGWTARPLTDTETAALAAGGQWDADQQTVTAPPPSPPDPITVLTRLVDDLARITADHLPAAAHEIEQAKTAALDALPDLTRTPERKHP